MTPSGWREDPGRGPQSFANALRTWRADGGPFALALCVLLLTAQLAWAGEGYRLELLFSALFGLLLLIGLVADPALRDTLAADTPWLKAAAILFLAVLGLGLLSLTAFAPGGANPIWTYVQASPAATLSRTATTATLVTLAGVGCAFLAGLAAGRRDASAERVFALLVPGFALFAAWALWAFATDPGGLWGQARHINTDRLTGGYSSANPAALAFGLGLVIALADLLRGLRRYGGPRRILQAAQTTLPRLAPAMAAIILCAAALALTQSRAGAAVTLVGLIALSAWESLRGGDQRGRTGLIGGAGVLALVGAFVLYRPEVFARLLNAPQDFETRRTIFSAHWRAFLSAPWGGYGLGTFDRLNNLLIDRADYPAIWNVRAAHNVILQWLVCGGLIGALPMFGAILAVLVQIAQGLRRRTRMTGWMRAILCASLVVLAANLTDYGLEEPALALLWAALLGLGAGLAAR
jgi:O-antigen ligase